MTVLRGGAFRAKIQGRYIALLRHCLVVYVIHHYEELIQNWPVRSINANNFGNRLCLQRLVSGVKFIAERQ